MNYIIHSYHLDGRILPPVLVSSITDVKFHLQAQTWLHGKLEFHVSGLFFTGDICYVVEALSRDVVRQESIDERAN